jgi:hypothetical protein
MRLLDTIGGGVGRPQIMSHGGVIAVRLLYDYQKQIDFSRVVCCPTSYPLIDRTYDLHKLPRGVTVDGDMWLLELSYEQIADYHLGMVFTPQQRVAFAAELFDTSDNPTSPQTALQALPAAKTMTRLSIPPQSIKTPVIVRPIG